MDQSITKAIDSVWRTNAGGELFNGITRMNLVSVETGEPLFFSERKHVTRSVIHLLINEGYMPQDMTQVIAENPTLADQEPDPEDA